MALLAVSLCCPHLCFLTGCATTVLVTGAGIGEMVLQLLVGSVSSQELAKPKRNLEFTSQTLSSALTEQLSASKALPDDPRGI